MIIHLKTKYFSLSRTAYKTLCITYVVHVYIKKLTETETQGICTQFTLNCDKQRRMGLRRGEVKPGGYLSSRSLRFFPARWIGKTIHIRKLHVNCTYMLYNFFGGYFFLRSRVWWPLLCLWRPFCIFEKCLDSNPERCRSKQVRYQLSSHPSPLLGHPSPYALLYSYCTYEYNPQEEGNWSRNCWKHL